MSFWHSACGPSSPDSRISVDRAAEDADISGLLGLLASIPDPRSRRGKQYSLEFALAVCVVAMLAGAKNYTEIARHAADMPQSLLRKLGAKWNWFRFRYQWPGKSAIWNVLTKADAAMMDRVTCKWLAAQARKDEEGEWVIALDGKVMRGAWTDENDKVTMFSAMLHDKAVTIAQVRVPDGTNEITQADTLLDAAGIPEGESVLVTIDAAHTQRETAEYIGGKHRQGKPARPAEASIRQDSPAPLRSPAPHHGGTQPGTDKEMVLLAHRRRRHRFPACSPVRLHPPRDFRDLRRPDQ